MGGQFVARGIIEDLANLRSRRFGAGLLNGNTNLARHQDRRGVDPIANTLFGRGRFTGQGMLINHGHPIDDVTINRDHITGMDGDDIAFKDLIERDFNFNAVLDQPGESWLLSKGIQQHLS